MNRITDRLLPALLTGALLLLLGMQSAVAMSLEQAKSEGLIGEKRDGYLGLVVSDAPDEVVALVNDVNRERRNRYQEIARENDIPLSAVAELAYARAVEATRSGHFIEDENGQWIRKP